MDYAAMMGSKRANETSRAGAQRTSKFTPKTSS